jgi:D-sedoheptulose 7-phosphate isomerase
MKQDINEIADVIFKAYQEGRQIIIFGNGGSASTSSHFVCDLSLQTAVKNKPRVRVIGLTDNMAVITARANDIDYSSVFKEQLITYLNKGDVVIGISASGNSPNVINAIQYAQENGASTVGLCGFGGGRLKELAEKSVVFSSRDYGQIEDIHLSTAHIISYLVKEKIAGE